MNVVKPEILLFQMKMFPGVHFLGRKDQKNLGYKITELLPNNSSSIRMIGYLFAIQVIAMALLPHLFKSTLLLLAIQHGAKMILEISDVIALQKLTFDFDPDNLRQRLVRKLLDLT